jgi:MOSC domain-containing protein YiiM
VNENRQGARVVGIYISRAARAESTPIQEARLEAGRGVVGDRYHEGTGTFSPARMDPDHQITLIAAEEIEAFNAASGRSVPHGAFRRNVVTRGVDLNALVGRRFRLGGAEARGIRLCEPCAHLASLVNDEVLERMVHRAGLRAEIVTGGIVRPGDPIETA